MISSLTWVKKGAAAEIPSISKLTDEEFDRISKQLEHYVIESKEDVKEAQKDKETSEEMTEEDKTIAQMYNLDNYDDDDQEEQALDAPVESDDEDAEMPEDKTETVPIFSNIKGLSYYSSNKEDPYIQLGDEVDEEEELDEMKIAPTDNMIIAAKTEDDVSHLEIYIYEEEEDNLFVHHDIMLPSFPLCVEWLDFPTGANVGSKTHGNYVAVGTFDPQVEIWDLDTVDAVFPAVILGGTAPTSNPADVQKKKKKKNISTVSPNPHRHVDAVMSISWNKSFRHLIATGSADTTLKLWDIQRPETASYSYTNHSDKVSALAWNPLEPHALLSGGYDRQACAFDSRVPTNVMKFGLSADVECIAWDPFVAERFYVSTEDGLVKCFDARHGSTNGKKPATPLFTLHAHDDAVSALSVHPTVRGCLLTGSADKTVKLWSLPSEKQQKPKCIASKDLDLGRVFCAQFSPDTPATVALAGSKGNLVVWNLESVKGVASTFPGMLTSSLKKANLDGGEKKTRPEVTHVIETNEDDDGQSIEGDDVEQVDQEMGMSDDD